MTQLALLFLGTSSMVFAAWPPNVRPFARATLTPKSNFEVSGTVDFAKGPQGLMVRAYLNHVPKGAHGFHIHEKGDCSAADASSAGEHFNPTGAKHGGPGAAARHAGDFGNLNAGADGNAQMEATIAVPKAGFDWDTIVGKAVIVHESADDLSTQPSGNAGKRIACGVIERSATTP